MEPHGSLALDDEAAAELGLAHLSEQQRQLVQLLVVSKPVAVCEAALFCLGICIVDRTLEVDYIATNPPADRARVPAPHGRSLVACTADKYAARPDGAAYDDLTLPAYFAAYNVAKPERNGNSAGAEPDLLGNVVRPRAPHRLVRFSEPHPQHAPDAFFYNKLLRHVPFRNEADLLPDGCATYLATCIRHGLYSADKDDLAQVRRARAPAPTPLLPCPPAPTRPPPGRARRSCWPSASATTSTTSSWTATPAACSTR